MPTYPTLRERVEAVLERAGFKAYDTTLPTYSSRGVFFLKPGVGVTVEVLWWDSSEGDIRALLLRFAAALRDAGLVVEDRGDRLYVEEPE